MVSDRRATEIAVAVLDQARTFPNAIVLATDSTTVDLDNCVLTFPDDIKLLVVDGQHRLWAQRFSGFEATFACVIHVSIKEPQMAALFVEINDTQKRVPSSLRWDLVRFVRPEADPLSIRASELVEGLNSERESPLYQRIDMTGEQPQLTFKQGSLAPEIKSLIRKKTLLKEAGFEWQLDILMKLFAAVREKDPDGWRRGKGYLYRNRVLRAFLKLLPRILAKIGKAGKDITPGDFYVFVRRVNLSSLSDVKVRAIHGNAGVAAITRTIQKQIFKR